MSGAQTISEAKRILLERFARGEFATSDLPPLSDRANKPPCASLSQEQVWHHSQRNRHIPQMYTESITIHRNGPLEISALKQSLREVLRRHESWRSTFFMEEGELRQLVHTDCGFQFRSLDLSGLPVEDHSEEALRIANEQARIPFDLERGPLVRATLVSFDSQRHRVYFDMHQIIADGISVYQILPTELTGLYESIVSSKPLHLPELSRQFADYAAWQRKWLCETTLKDQLDYWRDLLSSGPRPLPWPKDFERPPRETHRGAVEPFDLSHESVDQLQQLRQEAGVSLFAALLAAFSSLLYVYTRQDDICLGTLAPCGRHRTEFQKLLGYFMNPVALRLQVSPGQSFRELMVQAQDVIAGAISHGDVPFERVARELQIKSDPARHPLFQIAISLAPRLAPLPPGWDMTPNDASSGGARWDLYLEFADRPDYLLGRAQYNPDLFLRETIKTLRDDLICVLKMASAAPGQRISDISIASGVSARRRRE